jgi:hypothetical protein
LVERGRIAAHAFDEFVGELESENPAFGLVSLDVHVATALKRIPRETVTAPFLLGRAARLATVSSHSAFDGLQAAFLRAWKDKNSMWSVTWFDMGGTPIFGKRTISGKS